MKIAFITLGCKVNSYETEAIAGLFKEKGFTRVDSNEISDVYIINTCSVTNTADSKSRQKIRQAIKRNPNALIAVMGCYSQVKPEEVKDILGVDIVIGNKDKGQIVDLILDYIKNKNKIVNVENILKHKEFECLNACEFERTRAFLKIQDGCTNFCTYCIIPFARGPLRSRTKEDCFNEVEKIIKMGYKEIVLAGIHTGAYRDNDYSFPQLVDDLTKVKDLLRLRISSMEITEIDDLFLDILSKNNNLADHLHLPLQSGSDTVLERMNRKYNTKFYLNVLNKIRESRPNIAISTDLIVGFPGETEDEFIQTLEFLEKAKFSKIHVFPYSKRNGTKASIMPNQVNDIIKSNRVDKVMELDYKLQYVYSKQFEGQILNVIPEVYKDGYLIGHTSNFLKVKFVGKEELIGKNVEVFIKEVILDENLTKLKKEALQIIGNLV